MLQRDLIDCQWFSIMSFRRKWVSDTNLSKLLHETIEKREANKQSRLPDFCKDAILGATIKKISSALVLDSTSGLKTKLGIEQISTKSKGINSVSDELCSGIESIDNSWDEELPADIPLQMNVDQIDSEFLDIDDNDYGKSRHSDIIKNSQSKQDQCCSSPKRKRQPSAEGVDACSVDVDIVSSRASPLKKRRGDSSCKNEINGDFIELEACTGDAGHSSQYLYAKSKSSNHLAFEQYRTQRSRSLPHLTFANQDDLSIEQKPNFTSPKSVVNSISELSIQDCWEDTTGNNWCLTKNDVVDPDPLELNGFFQELKSVTVHPN